MRVRRSPNNLFDFSLDLGNRRTKSLGGVVLFLNLRLDTLDAGCERGTCYVLGLSQSFRRVTKFLLQMPKISAVFGLYVLNKLA